MFHDANRVPDASPPSRRPRSADAVLLHVVSTPQARSDAGLWQLARPVSRLTAVPVARSYSRHRLEGGIAIKKDEMFDDCIILSKESFDPDAMFMDDIVEDGVLPYLSLAVDGLNTRAESRKGRLELRPEDVAANEDQVADTRLPETTLGPGQLDVYGWESSWFRKLKGYLGL